MSALRLSTLLLIALACVGCSTGAWFKLPENSTLVINERPAKNNQGLVPQPSLLLGRQRRYSLPYRRQSGQYHPLWQIEEPFPSGLNLLATSRHRLLANGFRPTLL